MTMRVVVIHSFWRASSTYIWQRLRLLPGVWAFCEPFHETLSADLEAFPSNGSLDGSLRHPPVASYWDEYTRLGLSPSQLFSQRDGAFQRGDYYAWTDEKARYLQRLLAACRAQGAKVVVLGCVRSLAFAPQLKAWLAAEHPSWRQTHLLLHRCGHEQFQSGLFQWLLYSNPYFLTAHLEPLLATRPRLALACGFDPEWIRCHPAAPGHQAIAAWAAHLPQPWLNYARAYLANTTVCMARGRVAIDACLDLDRIAVDAQARSGAEQHLAMACGRRLCLSDFRLASHGAVISKGVFAALEQEMRPLALRCLEQDLAESMPESFPSGADVLAAHLHHVQEQLACISEQLARSEEENRRLKAEVQELHSVQLAMQRSRFWRLTRPLRHGLDALRAWRRSMRSPTPPPGTRGSPGL